MSLDFKKIWHDPVWSKVIAGAILAISALIATYFLDLWPAIGSGMSFAYAYIKTTWNLPIWLMILASLLSLPTIIFLLLALWFKIFPGSDDSPTWKSYKTDSFYNLRWRWSYFDDGQINSLTTYCPNCDFQLYAHDLSPFRVIDHIGYSCESCRTDICEFQESVGSLESKVRRSIQQKLRNGTWGN